MSEPAPIGYYWGDDDYSLEGAVTALARRVGESVGSALDRWRVPPPGRSADEVARRLAEIRERVATGTLFGGGTLALVAEPMALARSREDRESLVALLGAVAPGNALVFVESTTESKDERRSATLRALSAAVATAGGEVRRFPAPRQGEMTAWIERQAREREIRLGRGAARTLADRIGAFASQLDVDRRYQAQLAVAELGKLALFRPGGEVSSDDVRALVGETVSPSTWGLTDAVGERRLGEATDHLERLLDTTPEPVVVALLHRRLRELIEVADRLAAGEKLPAVARTMKLHEFRARTLAAQAQVWTLPELEAALEGLLELDVLVKGAEERAPTDGQRRLAFVLWVVERVGQREARGQAPARPDRARPGAA